jgi:hypothetical protein
MFVHLFKTGRIKVRIVFVLTFTLSFVGCTSGNVAYLPELKNHSLQAELYVPPPGPFELLPPSKDMRSGPEAEISDQLFAEFFEAMIVEKYRSVDINSILKKVMQPNNLPSNEIIHIVLPQSIPDLKNLRPIAPEARESKRDPEFDYTFFRDSTTAPYIFEYRIRNWGYRAYGVRGFLNYTAQIIDVQTNRIVWKFEENLIADYGTDPRSITPDLIQRMTEFSIAESLKRIAVELERVRKD